ncbi:helix-turn-helix domain-containing protein [Paludisphaera rhizosphaerae]|uniref:helix-turn-helix domain-containing protein n=1 Tax=Paludisphaera rhizosphaerae TaxID=2711216 RepID=UPI0013ECB6FA|nr:helix-turn-helix transcriptional regulator [Paludisphaera rhizosphaerae]
MELKQKLQMLMKSRNLNGQRLARLSKVSDSEISRILQGKSRPGLDNALRLAQAVGVSLDYLADDRIDVEPSQAEDALTAEDQKILGLCKKIGHEEALDIMKAVQRMGYEVAMARLLGIAGRPVIERDDQIGEPRPTALSSNAPRPTASA